MTRRPGRRSPSRRSERFLSIAPMSDSRPRMIDLFACSWLMLVGGRVCVRFVTLSEYGPDEPGAARRTERRGRSGAAVPFGLSGIPACRNARGGIGPFRADQVASCDRARASFPGGERGRPGEAIAVVVDDEQLLAAGLERGGGCAPCSVLSAVPSCPSVELDHSLTVPSWPPVVADRWPVGSNAMLVTGPAPRPPDRGLKAAGLVPQLDYPALGAGREGPVRCESERDRLVGAERMMRLPDLTGHGSRTRTLPSGRLAASSFPSRENARAPERPGPVPRSFGTTSLPLLARQIASAAK